MRDRSLDEFATDEASETTVDRITDDDVADDSDDVAGDADAPDRDDPDDEGIAADEAEDPDASVVPARSTYEWSPTGADCADCGARVERRWRDGDELVCKACKPW